MDSAAARVHGASTGVSFEDGLGQRRHIADPAGADTLELLCLRSELTSVPSFEFALRERTGRLSGFRHISYAHIRSVDRLSDPSSTLALVSEYTHGVRLSKLLTASDRPTLDINAAVHLIRQLVSAIAVLHEHARDVAHGAIGPERLIVTPNARLVVAEYALGAALEQLHYSHDRDWSELRIALPRSGGLPRVDQRGDVLQMGVVALSLVLGRELRTDEYPARASELLASARAISARGGFEPLPHGLRSWLAGALQLDPRTAFANALEARDELDKVLSDDGEYEEPAPIETPSAAVPPAAVVRATETPAVAPPPPPPAPKPTVAPAAPIERAAEPEIEPAGEPDGADEAEETSDSYLESSMPQTAHSRQTAVGRIAAVVVVLAAVIAGGAFGARRYLAPSASAAATGTLGVTSDPAGAQVVIDGQVRGVTPLSVALNPGPHMLELRGAGEPRAIPLTITAGTTVSQYIELPKAAAATGQLQIRTEPAGAQVSVDDVPRGPSPVAVDDLAAGEHVVSVTSDLASVKQRVTVAAGSTASVVVPLMPAEGAPVSGWIAVNTPADVQIFENKKLLGTSQSDRIMVSAGRHDLELVNETLGYRATKVVQVAPGKVSAVRVDWPKGTIALNAIPWADVWIDGEKVGETPIGNLSVPVGAHEVIFRHPDLGEQRHAVSVTATAPARLSVDMRKK